MTLEKARERLTVQVQGYNCNGARLILAEVQLERGQAAADQLMLEFQLESQFVFKPGTRFNRP